MVVAASAAWLDPASDSPTNRPLASLRPSASWILLALAAPALGQGGGGGAVIDLVEATHGFDRLLPHRIEELDANGMGTGTILDVRTLADLRENLSATNGVLPADGFPTAAVLPGGQPGNQFLSLRFSRALDVDSVLDSSAAGQANGSVAIFESGPNGVNGWGYDDVIGLAPYEFKNPKAIQALPGELGGAVAIAHEGPIDLQSGQAGAFGEGAVSILRIDSSVSGPQPLDPNELDDPQFRDMTLVVTDSVGESVLSGIPVDLAHDDQRNLGALPNVHSAFSAGAPAPVNGKGLVRDHGGARRGASAPDYLLVAVPAAAGGGVVDALRLDTAAWSART